MAESLRLEYVVSVTGLDEAAASLNSARGMALQAQSAVSRTRETTNQSLPVMIMGVRSLNALRLAVEQASKAITTFDPRAALYSFLNMVQVVRNLITLTRMLRESTGAAAAAEAVLAALTGRWWLIPLAIAAGAAVYAHIRSMQLGGLVEETGLYLLHRGSSSCLALISATTGPSTSPSRGSPGRAWTWRSSSDPWRGRWRRG